MDAAIATAIDDETHRPEDFSIDSGATRVIVGHTDEQTGETMRGREGNPTTVGWQRLGPRFSGGIKRKLS